MCKLFFIAHLILTLILHVTNRLKIHLYCFEKVEQSADYNLMSLYYWVLGHWSD